MNKVYLATLMAASMCFAARIGVLKGEDNCPGESVTIKLNTDTFVPSTRILSQKREGTTVQTGSIPVPGVIISNDKTSITFKYCVFDVSNFNNGSYRTKYDYAVLLLDDGCPTGSYEIVRHHDTEDLRDNYAWGNYYPNEVAHNATLHYCFVPRKTENWVYYPLFGGSSYYGFFASSAYKWLIDHDGVSYVLSLSDTEIFIKDERNRNENSWSYSGLPSSYQTAFNKIMSGVDDTFMHVAYRYDRPNGLYKSAEVENTSMPVDAQQLSAPMVKGLDRSAVAVELKSAGDVRISITNAKGAIVANIVENNLQAGVHQIKWNSGVIPNGRYIVTVKQNGMVNAKNVILK